MLDAKFLTKCAGVNPNLMRVVTLGVEKMVARGLKPPKCVQGMRTLAEQKALYAIGRTKPGKKVTWTLNSKHRVQPDGTCHAIDLLPYPYDWKDLKQFDLMAECMFEAAAELGIDIRWGADWDEDGQPRERGESDSPHFELAA